MAEVGEYDGTTAIAVVKQQQGAWEKLNEKITSIPFFAKLRGVRVEDTAAYKKSQEVGP